MGSWSPEIFVLPSNEFEIYGNKLIREFHLPQAFFSFISSGFRVWRRSAAENHNSWCVGSANKRHETQELCQIAEKGKWRRRVVGRREPRPAPTNSRRKLEGVEWITQITAKTWWGNLATSQKFHFFAFVMENSNIFQVGKKFTVCELWKLLKVFVQRERNFFYWKTIRFQLFLLCQTKSNTNKKRSGKEQ